jgi:hypothetical protein
LNRSIEVDPSIVAGDEEMEEKEGFDPTTFVRALGGEQRIPVTCN